MNTISKDKKYKTKNGHPVTILSISARCDYPVIGLIHFDNEDKLKSWNINGSWADDGQNDKFDLVEVKPYEEFIDNEEIFYLDDNNTWKPGHFAKFDRLGNLWIYPGGKSKWTHDSYELKVVVKDIKKKS